MSPKTTGITRKELIVKAKKAGIKNFDEMSDKQLVNAYNKYLKNRRSHNIYKSLVKQLKETSIKYQIR